MKNPFILLSALLMVAFLLPACSPAPEVDCTSAELFCVGMLTDSGKINDLSMNQAAWEAVQRAEQDLGARIQYVESSDASEHAQTIAALGDEGYDIIVTVGPALGEATAAAAAHYPETDFIGVDQFQAEVVEGVAGLTFPEDQAGFLVGALASFMSQNRQIGAICGADAGPAAWRYAEGFQAGAAYADQFKGVVTNISTVYPGKAASTDPLTGPEAGAETAQSMIAAGADVIFGCGGSAGNSAITTAAEEHVYVIGVDTDQYLSLPEAAPQMLSSAIKLVTPGVYDLIRLSREGQFPSGNYIGDVSYAPFHDLENEVPLAVKGVLQQIDAGLQNGSIQTNVAPLTD